MLEAWLVGCGVCRPEGGGVPPTNVHGIGSRSIEMNQFW